MTHFLYYTTIIPMGLGTQSHAGFTSSTGPGRFSGGVKAFTPFKKLRDLSSRIEADVNSVEDRAPVAIGAVPWYGGKEFTCVQGWTNFLSWGEAL